MVDNDLIRNKGIMSAAQTMWTIDFDSEQSLEIGKVQNQKFTGKCWIYAGLNLLIIILILYINIQLIEFQKNLRSIMMFTI